MRKIIVYSLAIVLFCAVLVSSNVLDSLAIFLLSGSLPGTPINLSPTMMMAILVAIAWLTLTHFTSLGTSQFLAVRRLTHRHIKRHERMPKRRYGRI